MLEMERLRSAQEHERGEPGATHQPNQEHNTVSPAEMRLPDDGVH